MSTVDLVQGSVMAGMLRGELVPGTWLRQDDLAERLGVSKIPVREALQRLAAIGLLRFEANRGVVVPSLSAAEAEENYALRRLIEPMLLDRALPNLSIVDLAEAELALSSDSLSLTEANWAFHRALYRASECERGMAMTEILHAAVAPYVVLYTERLGGAKHSDDEHGAILDACRHGDRTAARSLLIQHLDAAAEALDLYLKEEGRQALRWTRH
ncbi:MAG: GntR family transcriptional regulator [Actinobacteria bacterium]|nr:GntR family transcriptional regulator [Actinomycetota bacterium]